jgi:streptomycin 3"-kinase
MTPLVPPKDALLPPPPAGVEWLEIGLGASGDRVFRRSDGAAFAKLSGPGRAAGLQAERDRTQWLAPHNIGGPGVLDWILSDGHACLVTSTVEGVPASELSPTDLLKAWPSLVRQLKRLHGLKAGDCPFERGLAESFAQARDVVSRGAVNPDFLAPQYHDVPPNVLLEALEAELPQRLSEEAGDLVVCHGDACLPNFLVDPDTLHCTGLIDLGRLGRADRYADLSLLSGNAREHWASPKDEHRAQIQLFDMLGIDAPDMRKLAFYLALDPLTWG